MKENITILFFSATQLENFVINAILDRRPRSDINNN